MEVNREFCRENPELFTVSVNEMDTLLDSKIKFQGSEYTTFAVAYCNTVHFIARIKMNDGVYEYDGTSSQGRLHLLEFHDPFTEKILTISGNKYKAQMVWYKKSLASSIDQN